jgi:hypothetical protein
VFASANQMLRQRKSCHKLCFLHSMSHATVAVQANMAPYFMLAGCLLRCYQDVFASAYHVHMQQELWKA